MFRFLREERQLTLNDFKAYHISKSTLEKFENGQGNLPFDKLDEALQAMNVTLHEYSYLLNNGTNDYFIEIFEEIDRAFYLEDKSTLKQIYDDNIIYPEGCYYALCAKACYTALEKEEQEKIADLLIGTEYWGAKELWIFTDTIDQLSNPLLLSLLNEFLAKSNYFHRIVDYNRLITQAINTAVLTLINRNMGKEAKMVLDKTAQDLWEVDLFSRNVHLFLLGLWLYSFSNQTNGEEKMKHSIQIFNMLGSTHLENKYQKIYDTTLKKHA
ncbi:helix-turn-helix domain-containing protein [Lactococcus sp. dk310]|uniref:Rgg/GadR/MutR family transcriptional regulator n=1 Tax=unclassified Lactococcus TaxID=2643510 RepID=UPI003519F17F